MSEWYFIVLLVVLAVVASILILYPLRHHRFFAFCLLPVLVVLSGGGYWMWGDFASWQQYVQHSKSQQRIQAMLQSIKSPQELIKKLREKLDDNPQSAKGWYLLGRLYSAHNEQKKAADAFAKASSLEPANEQYTVHYAHSLWQLNQQHFTPKIITMFQRLLKANPQQADALAMLAMNAYMNHSYEQAIAYWQRLLALAPEHSEEALALRKAIAKAQQQINVLGRW